MLTALVFVWMGYGLAIDIPLAHAQGGCDFTLSPGQSIESALNSASEGDTICLQSGEYYENVTSSVSGSSGQYITIRSVSGNPQDVTVNAGEDRSDPSQWTQHSGNIYYTTGISWRPGIVVQDDVAYGPGVEKNKNRCEGSLSDLDQAGECYYDQAAGNRLYAWAFGGGNPGQYKLEIGRGVAFNLENSSFIRIKGLTLKNGFSRNGGAGVKPGPNIIIEDSILYHNRWGVVSPTAFDDGEPGAISINDVQILNNEMYENGDGILFWFTDRWVMRGNDLHNNYDDGADGLSGPWDCLVEFNRFHDNGEDGFKLGNRGRQAKNCIVRNNLAYDNGSGSFKIGGISHEAYYNTGVNGFFSITGPNHIIRNNLMNGASYWMTAMTTSDIASLTMDHNLGRDGNTVNFPNSMSYDSFDDMCTDPVAQGQGCKSITTDNPDFVNSGAHDYHLQSSSSARDAGIDVGVNVDFDGNSRPAGSAPDIGAYEFGGIVTPPFCGDGTCNAPQEKCDECIPDCGLCSINQPPQKPALNLASSNPGPGLNYYLEAEGGTITSPMQIGNDQNASGGQYIDTPAGTGSTTNPSAEATYSIDLSSSGIYYLWVRTYVISVNNDATYAGFNGSYTRIWPLNLNVYEWVEVGNGHSLNAGSHQITIGHGEEQARIDRIYVTDDTNGVPNDGAPNN